MVLADLVYQCGSNALYASCIIWHGHQVVVSVKTLPVFILASNAGAW